MLVVVLNEFTDRLLKLPGEFVVPQLDHVLHRSVIALNLALGHGVVWRPSDMIDVLPLEILLQLAREITRSVPDESVRWSIQAQDQIDLIRIRQ